MNWKRGAVIGTVSTAVVAAIVMGMRPQPLEVETVSAAMGPMEVTIEEEGKTRLRDRFVVSAPLTGYLRRHELRVGDQVSAGQLIALLEPARAESLDVRKQAESNARVQAASAVREVADARLKTAEEQRRATAVDAEYWKQQLAREEKLLASGDLPKERVDKTRTEATRTQALLQVADQAIAQARADIARARAEVDVARAAASNPVTGSGGPTVPVRSPVGGRVVKVARQSEGSVAAGEPIIELGNTKALEVEVELLSPDAIRVAPGTAIRLSRWGGDGPLEAHVRTIEPTGFTKISALGVEEQRVRVIADIISPEPLWTRLGEGYRVEAAFILWSSPKVLRVPASALFRDGEKWAVYVVEGESAKKRNVEIGHRNGLQAEIVGGVREGELVIPHPDEKLNDGLAVKMAPPKS